MDVLDKLLAECFIDDGRKEIEEKYKEELKHYKFISSLDEFIKLPLKGSIRYVNKRTKELKFGGLLTKIYKNQEGNWQCAIMKSNRKMYYVGYKSNFIYYIKSSEDRMSDWANIFISKVDNGLFELI